MTHTYVLSTDGIDITADTCVGAQVWCRGNGLQYYAPGGTAQEVLEAEEGKPCSNVHMQATKLENLYVFLSTLSNGCQW